MRCPVLLLNGDGEVGNTVRDVTRLRDSLATAVSKSSPTAVTPSTTTSRRFSGSGWRRFMKLTRSVWGDWRL
ncbi:MAG: hypothetical protein H6661_09505 [Ardenticatenaceae bacterium]|nr:hypothetical protein [Ardenticatenaceae bacterium]